MYFEHTTEKYWLLNINLSFKLAGLEHASLARARLFQEQMNITPTIVTTKYNNRLIDIRDHLIEQGLLKKSIPVINMYEYFQGTYTDKRIQKKHPHELRDDWSFKTVTGTRDVRVYQKNRLIMYQKRTDSGDLHYINYFNNGKKIRRDGFDCNGFLSLMQVLEPKTNQVLQETYYTVNGSPCIVKHFSHTKKGELESIMLIDNDGNVTEVFQEEEELIAYWLELITNTPDIYYMVVDKNRVYYEVLQKIKDERFFIIPAIHAIHTKNAIDVSHSKLNINYAPIFKDVSKADAIVFLTEKQKQDAEKRFGPHGNYYVIPHALTTIPAPVPFETRERYKVVTLARLSKEKHLDLLIKIFAEVARKIPEANLEIYGFGPEKNNLLHLIRELEMEDNISIKGYTDNPAKVYETAALLLLTSQGEGFSLVTMESLAHGCPVISFDINYGPSDMIHDSENGFLIPRDEKEMYINRVIAVLTDQHLNKRLSINAYQYIQDFYPGQIAKKWKNLLNEIKEVFN